MRWDVAWATWEGLTSGQVPDLGKEKGLVLVNSPRLVLPTAGRRLNCSLLYNHLPSDLPNYRTQTCLAYVIYQAGFVTLDPQI